MFHFDRGIKLTAIDLAVDVRRRQPRGFVSHAHTDHIAPHVLAYCTPETGVLYRHRLGAGRNFVPMPFGEPIAIGEYRLTAIPAGHILGSAMLLVEGEGKSLLYTGDFKLGPSATAGEATIPEVDVLIMECTFGSPEYRLPPREMVIGQLLETVREAIETGFTPIIHAYVLGKAQEVTKILASSGIGVLQHPLAYEISQLYRQCGCDLGEYERFDRPRKGFAIVAPPRNQKGARLGSIERSVSIAVTGWAIEEDYRRRNRVDFAFPLSDHADFDDLLTAARLANPRVVYCTHGPDSFATCLQDAGFDARVLGKDRHQLRLF